jgi:trimeric autotransporter adhesin
LKTLRSSIPIFVALIAVGAASAQTVSVSPTSLTFTGLVGGATVSQPLNITSTGGSTTVAVFPSQSWLTVSLSPSNGVTPVVATVTANPTGLTAGTYTDNNFRVITSTQTLFIPVTFTVGSITVTPQSLTFAYTLGNSSAPPSQILTVNGQNLNFTVSSNTSSGGAWLQAVPGGNQVNVALNGLVLSTLTTGTYQGTVTITQFGSSPINVPVTLTVSPEPPVTVAPTSVNLNFQIGGQNNLGAQQPVTFSTTSTAAVPWLFGQPSVNPNPAGRNWILVNPTSGSVQAGATEQSVISYDTTANLPAGTYTGTVPVAATGGQINTGMIPVNLFVSSNPLLVVPTQALNFTYELGGVAPAAQNVTAQSTAVPASSTTGQMPIVVSYTVANNGTWFIVSPTNNLNTGTPFTVTVNPTNLAPGTYTGTITVTPAPGAVSANGAQTIAVTLTVANDPAIVASTTGITFPYQVGQTPPPTQTVNLTSSTGALLNYIVTSTETSCGTVSWLTLGGSTSGSTNGSFTVTPSNLASLTAGTCTGTITVTATNPASGNPAINSPLTIPVTLYVSTTPLLSVTPASLSFTSAVSGSGGTQQITVSSTNASSNLTYTVSFTTNNGNNNWLSASPLSGSTATGSNVVNVSVIPGILSPGIYTGTVTITSTGVADSPITVPVALQVTSGTLTLSSNSLNFTYTVGGSTPAAQTVQVTSNSTPLSFTAAANSGIAGTNWLSVTPTSGTTPGSLSISVSPTNLAAGTYTGTVVVTSPNAAGSPAAINVTFAVNSGTITATPAPTAAGLIFTQAAGGNASAPQTISLAGSPGAISFTTAATTVSGGNWLIVTPSSGTTPVTVSVSVNAASLPVGTYMGTVTITAPGATGSPITYPVTVQVTSPVGIVATPSTLKFAYTLNTTAPPSQTVAAAFGQGATYEGPGFTATVATTNGGNWLTATPATSNLGSPITVSVNPQGLAAGTYTGTVTISAGNNIAYPPAVVPVQFVVTAAPTPVIGAVVNAASYAAGALAPGQEVAVFGSNFGPASPVSATITNNSFPTTLSNTQVLFDGTAAPIIAVTNGQVNVMVPYGIAGRATTMVQVVYLGVSSSGIAYNVTATSPGIYTLNQAGTGQGAILNQNLSGNSSSNPAAKGSVIAIYMTGEGVTAPPSATGQLAPSDGSGLNHPVQTVTATVGGVAATVQYAGSAPGLVYGVMQVNVLIPSTVSSGAQPLVVTVGTTNSQSAVTVAVQ